MANIISEFYYDITDTYIDLYDDGIVVVRFGRATVNLEENTAETKWVEGVFHELIEKSPTGSILVIMDFSNVDNAEYNSDESNKIYLKLLKEEATKKIAMFGLAPGWELFINIFKYYVKGKIETFHTKEEARHWLEKFKE